MPEMINKKRTEAKVFLLEGLFIDRPDHEFELARAVIHRCCEEIDKQPTIYPEVRHGRWIELPKALNPEETPCKCSACGHILSFYGYYPKSNFCPNCGAQMDAKDTNVSTKGGADHA